MVCLLSKLRCLAIGVIIFAALRLWPDLCAACKSTLVLKAVMPVVRYKFRSLNYSLLC